MTMDRRRFIGYGGTTLLSLVPRPGWLAAWVPRRESPPERRTLVLLFLRGGFDGLSAVVPHGDAHYSRLRRTIAVHDPLDLDGFFGLHPSLAPLAPLYARGELAVVHAAGLPTPHGAHADAQAALRNAAGHLVPIALGAEPPPNAAYSWEAAGASYPPSPLGSRLRRLAALIKAGSAPQVSWIDAPGWDQHVLQGGIAGPSADRLRDLGACVAAFHYDLSQCEAHVTVATVTEFGRSVAENRTGGTDHGRGGAVLVVGPGVRGGRVYGRWPGLAPDRHQGGGLAVTTDLRDIFDELSSALRAGGTARSLRSPPPLGLLDS